MEKVSQSFTVIHACDKTYLSWCELDSVEDSSVVGFNDQTCLILDCLDLNTVCLTCHKLYSLKRIFLCLDEKIACLEVQSYYLDIIPWSYVLFVFHYSENRLVFINLVSSNAFGPRLVLMPYRTLIGVALYLQRVKKDAVDLRGCCICLRSAYEPSLFLNSVWVFIGNVNLAIRCLIKCWGICNSILILTCKGFGLWIMSGLR